MDDCQFGYITNEIDKRKNIDMYKETKVNLQHTHTQRDNKKPHRSTSKEQPKFPKDKEHHNT
jgi:hypothetical protein